MKELSPVERIKATREAGNVRRFHVVPHVGEYTVGKHSYDAVSMLLVLHPSPSVHLIKALLWHDGAERWVGDMPRPAVIYNYDLFHAYDQASLSALQTWEMYEGFEFLTDEDFRWLNSIDILESWVWCQEQLAFGNRHCEKTLLYLSRSIEREFENFPMPCREFYINYHWSRLPENCQQ